MIELGMGHGAWWNKIRTKIIQIGIVLIAKLYKTPQLKSFYNQEVIEAQFLLSQKLGYLESGF